MNMVHNLNSLKSWSLIDPKPVLYLDDSSKEWVCVWGGIFMTAEHALILSAKIFWGNYPSMEMIRHANDKMIRLYSLGIWGNQEEYDWKHILREGAWQYYNRAIPNFLNAQKFNLPSEFEVLKWFSKVVVKS
jgi:hypothetical protein